jgi:hypothetical protein
MPAIATEMVFILLQSFTTTCFGPYGLSSDGTQHHYHHNIIIDVVFHPMMALRGQNMLW